MDGPGSSAGYQRPLMFQSINGNNGSVYPSGSKSASASPGPIHRFKQNYGKELPKANFSSTNQHTMTWLQSNQYNASVDQGARSGSVMSGYSTSSAATNMSQLSIRTDDTALTVLSYMPVVKHFSDPIQKENASTGEDIRLLTTSFIESLKFGQTDLDQTLVNIKECAKFRRFDYLYDDAVCNLIEALFYRLKMLSNSSLDVQGNEMDRQMALDQRMALIHHNFGAIHYVINMSKRSTQMFLQFASFNHCELSKVLCRFLDVTQDHTRFVLLIIDTLINNRFKSTPEHVKNLRHVPGIIERFVAIIQSKSKSLVRIALNVLSVIIRSDKKLKLRFQFCQQQGLEVLLNILNTENEEKLLHQTASTLFPLISQTYETSREIFVAFFQLGGVHICAKHLDHGSPRFLTVLMKCLSCVADIRELTSRLDLSQPIQNVFKLLGSHDTDLVSLAIGFLGNVATNNDPNKLLLVQMNAPLVFFRVMAEAQVKVRGYNQVDAFLKKFEEVIDHSLWAIGLLTSYTLPEDIKQQATNSTIDQICQYYQWQVYLLDAIESQQWGFGVKSYAFNLLTVMFTYQPLRLNEFKKKFSSFHGLGLGDVIYNALGQFFNFTDAPNAVPFHHLASLAPEQKRAKCNGLFRLLSVLNILVQSPLFGRATMEKIVSHNYWLLSFINDKALDDRIRSELISLTASVFVCDPTFCQHRDFNMLYLLIRNYAESSNENVATAAKKFCQISKEYERLAHQRINGYNAVYT